MRADNIDSRCKCFVVKLNTGVAAAPCADTCAYLVHRLCWQDVDQRLFTHPCICLCVHPSWSQDCIALQNVCCKAASATVLATQATSIAARHEWVAIEHVVLAPCTAAQFNVLVDGCI